MINKVIWLSVYRDNDPNPPQPTPPQSAPPDDERRFSQQEVDRFLADDRRKTKAQTEKMIAELEQLKKSKNLSEKERADLSARIEELQNQVLTKEQLLEKERTRLQTEHRSELQREKDEKEGWRVRYTESTIVRSIMDAAIEAGAYSPEQIVNLLKSETKLVEDKDQEGNSLGSFTPRVKFRDTDAEGRTIYLDLTVIEVIKRMKELPDRFGNLFKANLSGGLGGNGSVA